MGRPVKYAPGTIVGPEHCKYHIVERTLLPHMVWVKCHHEGCNVPLKVNISNCISGTARKWCDEHRATARDKRVSKQRAAKYVARQLEMLNESERRESYAVQPQTITATPMAEQYTPFDQLAHRLARTALQMPWVSFRREGTVEGWMLVTERATSEGGAVQWRCTCALCGAGRTYYAQQIDRQPIPRCGNCMGSKKWYQRAADCYKMWASYAARNGKDMKDPFFLLRCAHTYGETWKHEVPGFEGMSAKLYATLERMVEDWKAMLIPAPVVDDEPPTIESQQINDDSPLHLWSDERFNELLTSDKRLFDWLEADNYTKFDARMVAYNNERARRAALQESNDQA